MKFSAFVLILLLSGMVRGAITISEVMAKNEDTIQTALGVRGLDWIELHNDGAEDVNVAEWYLSDNPDKKPGKWKRIVCDGAAIVPAGGYLLVWADKDCTNYADGEAHVAIGLSTDGERLFVASPETTSVDAASIFTFGRQIKDISFGLDASGNACYFREPTPGAANTSPGFGPPSPTVLLSEPHGFKDASFEVTMSATDEQTSVYYTTNGLEPTVESGVKYDGTPLVVSRTTLLRAAAPTSNSVMQTVATATYLFADDVLEQGRVPSADFPTNNVNGQILEYGFESSVVAAHRDAVKAALTSSVPVYSIVGDVDDFFGAKRGIYVNGSCEGRDWERKVSVELFDPSGCEEGFQIDCGIRLRGAYSRRNDVPKHSFRLFFRSEYGAGKLDYPLFGEEGASSFNKIDLRTSQNNSWATDRSANETFVHETFCRDVQRDQGEPYTRSRYCHLFLNGQYWGLYQTQERDDCDYASDYLGGDAESWDSVRTSMINGSYCTTAADGNMNAFEALRGLVNAGVSDAAYHRMKGENPNGTANENYPAYLDDVNLMDYIIALHYTHDPDGPWSLWNGLPNNLHSLYNRDARDGFVWLRHDGEHAMGMTSHYYDPATTSCLRWGDVSGSFTSRKFTPAGLHARLADFSPQYRRKFAARLEAQCFRDDGVLAVSNSIRRFRARMEEVDGAIWAECARWGRGQFDKQSWSNACERCIRSFIVPRIDQLKRHYRQEGWYPSIAQPVIEAPSGACACGTVIRLSAAGGAQVVWTDDGEDPADSLSATRVPSGTDTYTVGIKSVVLRARAYDAQTGDWSLMSEVNVSVLPPATNDLQCLFLRVAAVDFGSGSDGVATITCTNLSPDVVIPLDGLVLHDDASNAQADNLLAMPMPETCPSGAVVRLPLTAAPAVSSVSWRLASCAGETIQTLRLSSEWTGFGETATGLATFAARHTDAALETEQDWYPIPVFNTEADVVGRMCLSADPGVASNVVTVADGRRLASWAYRLGMTLGDVLTKTNAYVSFALDAPFILDPAFCDSLTSNDVTISGISAKGGADGACAITVAIRDLPIGDSAVDAHLSRFFSFSGCADIAGPFTRDAVTTAASACPDGHGSAVFTVKPSAAVPTDTSSFFIRASFNP